MIGIYLSGTGNTKHCIEKLVGLIDNSAKVFPLEMPNLIDEIKKNDTIILGYPTQYSNAAGNQKEYNYEIPCGTGEIVIGEEVYYGIKPEEKINNNAQKLINIECNVGDITVDFTGA